MLGAADWRIRGRSRAVRLGDIRHSPTTPAPSSVSAASTDSDSYYVLKVLEVTYAGYKMAGAEMPAVRIGNYTELVRCESRTVCGAKRHSTGATGRNGIATRNRREFDQSR